MSEEGVQNQAGAPTEGADANQQTGQQAVEGQQVQQQAQTLEQQAQVEITKAKVPEEYKDRGYMKNLAGESGEVEISKLYKEIDDLQTLKGRKTIPFDYDNANPEQIQAHIESIRPESPEAYNFVEGKVAPGTEESISNIFYENGIHPKVAEKVMTDYLAHEQATLARLCNPEDFKAEIKQSFGDGFEARASELGNTMKSLQSESDQKIMGAMTNSQLAMVYRLADSIVKNYGVNESALGQSGNQGIGGVGSREQAVREEKAAYDAIVAMKKGGNYTKEQYSAAVQRHSKAAAALRKANGGK